MSFFEFATWRRSVLVRVHGLANMNNSHLFKDLVDALLERAYDRFFIDLADCTSIDSTFMGVLVGIPLYEPESDDNGQPLPAGEADRPCAVVLNVGDHCSQQLDSVGLGALIPIKSEEVDLPEGAVLERIEEKQFDPEQRTQLIVDAHRNLVRANDRNEQVFGSVLDSLAEELERRRAEGGDQG